MPIKPENEALYPADWSERVQAVVERSGGRCEWCGAPEGESIRRLLAAPWIWLVADMVPSGRDAEFRVAVVVQLQTAHLDRKLVNHELWNLAALCQRCHWCLDRKCSNQTMDLAGVD